MSQSNTMRRCWLKIWLLLVCAIGFTSMLEAKQLAVVTDAGNPAANVSAGELQKIFNLRTRTWTDGKAVILVMRDPSSSEMQLVLRKVLNMTPEQAASFIQAHKSSIVIADSDEAVIRFVSSNHGAIGIVDLYSLTKDVHVVKVDGKLPVEQGYLLRGE
jgi:ABC-type phosphate transport system substrate-binding protein